LKTALFAFLGLVRPDWAKDRASGGGCAGLIMRSDKGNGGADHEIMEVPVKYELSMFLERIVDEG
jgi:hypothetical protein